ncbi:MAG TPA: histidine--tRNA ligase, partial [Sulfitobacter sp.]|nr:histidine--tRNA ligase [Sulfitobacter sp.]
MVTELRQAGIRAEVDLGNPKNFGNQMKYADKRQSPVVVIEGGDEKDRGVVQIKDMVLGAQLAQEASHDEWKERKNQYEVKRSDLVQEVRNILDRTN